MPVNAGIKFPMSLIPLNEFFQDIEIFFCSEKEINSLGSSGSISSLFQNLSPSEDAQELIRKPSCNNIKSWIDFIFNFRYPGLLFS